MFDSNFDFSDVNSYDFDELGELKTKTPKPKITPPKKTVVVKKAPAIKQPTWTTTPGKVTTITNNPNDKLKNVMVTPPATTNKFGQIADLISQSIAAFGKNQTTQISRGNAVYPYDPAATAGAINLQNQALQLQALQQQQQFSGGAGAMSGGLDSTFSGIGNWIQSNFPIVLMGGVILYFWTRPAPSFKR